MAIAGQWAASGQQLAGEFDVPQDLVVGEHLELEWPADQARRWRPSSRPRRWFFSTTASTALAIVDGTVQLHGTGRVLALDSLTYGELGQLSGNASLAGEYGWYGAYDGCAGADCSWSVSGARIARDYRPSSKSNTSGTGHLQIPSYTRANI